MIVVSTGCPASVGPEISLVAAASLKGIARILVGDPATLLEAAELVGLPRDELRRLPDAGAQGPGLYIHAAGPALCRQDRVPGKPSPVSGAAQLAYVEEAYRLARAKRAPLVTAAVSKLAIARSGGRRAGRFRGHTEWLQQLDGARTVTMCFVAEQLSTALVTTHVPLRRVAKLLRPEDVQRATVHLARLLAQLRRDKPSVAVASLNPHAGEGELLGNEEAAAIIPGIQGARRRLRGIARVEGPMGAETAFRLAAAGKFDGVVAMYHDQATIPMKLLAFGSAVNVTMGLSVVRTSVDHGTAYDIAWQGTADASGMRSAMALAAQLAQRRAG